METIVIFKIGAMKFGVNGDQVSQILRLPPITPVPLTTEEIKGVSIIDGKTCQVISLSTLLQTPDEVDMGSGKARLITQQIGQELISFPTDEVLQTLEVTPDQFTENNDSNAHAYSIGLFHHEGETIQVIDLTPVMQESLLESLPPYQPSVPLPNTLHAIQKETPSHFEETLFYLIFRLGGERFALETRHIKELMFANVPISPVAEASPEVLGVIERRSQLINVVDLASLLGFPDSQINNQTRFLIIEDAHTQLAIMVDEIEEAREILASQIEVNQADQAHKVYGLTRLEEGKIVSIISPNFLQAQLQQNGLSKLPTGQPTGQTTQGNLPMTELAVFKVENEFYAFEIEQVQEIIKFQPLNPIPDPPQFVEGVINLRGRVIPVVNLPNRLGFSFTPNESSKMIVGLLNNELVAFLVDEVEDVMLVDDQTITYSQDPDTLIHATITLQESQQVILWLRLEQVLPEAVKKLMTP